MKSILYVGATLMIGASIYGFVGYKQNNQRKEFKEMYEPEKKKATVVEEKKLQVADEKLVVMEDKKITASFETKKIESPATTIAVKEKQSSKKIKKAKKKKLDYRQFSRAPLREPRVVEMEATPPVEIKKTTIKEQ